MEGVIVPPPEVREKKAALVEVIELQRLFIAQRGSEGAVGDGGDDDEEMRWYTEQAARLEKFKAALNAVRLQPDEFPILVPQRWAVRDGSSSSSRELIPYALRINARSQLTFVPVSTVSSSGGGSSRSGTGGGGGGGGVNGGELEVHLHRHPSSDDDDAATGGGGFEPSQPRPRVVFIDQLRQVRVTQPELDGAGALAVPRAQPAAGAPASAPTQPLADAAASGAPPPRALCLELLGEPPLTCVTPEAGELVEVLGAHLRRYNSSRVSQVRALKQLHALKGTTYDPRDPTHESLLARLWVCGFGADPPWKARSERWVHLGFQSDDPTRDFRAMGVLGLANLVYFGEHYPDVFQRLVGAQRRRDYPLACAGINITSLLVDLLNMRDEGGPASVQSRPPFDAGWSSDGFHFFCHMFYRDRAFEDMYCFCLRLLDRMYVSMDADYADFNTVLAALRSRLVDALAQRPLSFREFKRLIAAGGADSEGSATSCGNAAATPANAGSSASSADAAGEEGEHEQLAHTIAEVMATLPRHLEGMKVGLKGAAAALLSKSSLLSPPSAAAATTGKATTSTTGNGDADGGGGDGGDAAASVEDPPCAGSHST
jgi:hypothetical protein